MAAPARVSGGARANSQLALEPFAGDAPLTFYGPAGYGQFRSNFLVAEPTYITHNGDLMEALVVRRETVENVAHEIIVHAPDRI